MSTIRRNKANARIAAGAVGVLGAVVLALLAVSVTMPVGAQEAEMVRRDEKTPVGGIGLPDPTFCVGDPCPGQTCDPVNSRCVGTVTLQPPMGAPMLTLSANQLARFEAGALDFNRPLTLQEGLGPIFNKSSCGGCHATPLGGGGGIAVNRFGFIDPVTLAFDPLADLGGSLQQIQAIREECAESIPLPEANVVSKRMTNSTLGFGLVEVVADSDIEANALTPPSPAVSGRALLVPVLEAPGETKVGRFGWKCQVATILSFSGDAALNEMGLTNRLVSEENAPNGDLALLELCDDVPDPEDGPDAQGRDFIDRTTDFQRYLAPPPQTPRFGMTGEAVFNEVGCADCHVQSFTTPAQVSDDEDDDALLANTTLTPYSDFLVHDVGFAADFIEQGDAGIFELRTPPLWGMRKRDPMWHDGRVAGGNLTFRIIGPNGVIDQHGQFGSEAEASADAFRARSASDQAALVSFLDSLGRREFDMDGNGLLDEFDAVEVESCSMNDSIVTPDDECAVADADQDGDVDDADLELFAVALGLDSGLGDEGGDEEADEEGDGSSQPVSVERTPPFSSDFEREFSSKQGTPATSSGTTATRQPAGTKLESGHSTRRGLGRPQHRGL